jgi:hypothetical protein
VNTSELLTETRDLVDDPVDSSGDGKKFSNAKLIRLADRFIRGTYRSIVNGNKEWSNFELCLQKEDAIELFDSEWEYRLPTWITHVTNVWIRDGSATTETSSSPYRWVTLGTVRRGRLVPRYAEKGRECWSWQGNHTLRLSNYTDSQELIVSVAVRPARLFKAKIATANAAQDKLYLPPTPSYGEIEIEEGCYINSEFQVTTTASANATHYGNIRRCIYSKASELNSGSRVHQLVFDANWTNTLAVDDVIETLVPIADEHTRLIVLQIAMACMQSKGNKPGIASILPELNVELGKFEAFATKRDSAGPSFIRRGQHAHPVRQRNPDRLGWW